MGDTMADPMASSRFSSEPNDTNELIDDPLKLLKMLKERKMNHQIPSVIKN